MQVDIAALPRPRTRPTPRAYRAPLEIGLVNLMPPTALRRTEMEFRALLRAAPADAANVELRCFAQHHDAGQSTPFAPLAALWDAPLDGLIVTGAEPAAASMQQEPLLPLLRELVSWASENTSAALFSCFAAHGAAWCLDEIPRQRLPEKLSGVFACEKAAAHPITAHLPPSWATPHSRYNTLDEQALRAAGYVILSRVHKSGPDMFAKTRGHSEFLFVQGHPEYGPHVLLGEYRRDMKRYQNGLLGHKPHWPETYDESDSAWRDSAAGLMQGWLRQLAARRAQTDMP